MKQIGIVIRHMQPPSASENGLSPAEISRLVERMLGCFRKIEAADPDVYVAAICAVLARYPEVVVRHVTDPTKGLPTQLGWSPSIAEVKSACEQKMAPIHRDLERQQRQAESCFLLGGTAPKPVSAEERDRVVRHWFDQVRPQFEGWGGGKPRVDPEERLAELRAQANDPIPVSEVLRAKLEDTRP